VDISAAQLSNAANTPVTYQSFVVGHRVTVIGALDATNPMLVHAYTVRDFGLTSVTPPIITPPPGGQLIAPENLFRLSAEERAIFTPPDQSWLNPSPFKGNVGPPMKSAWDAFNTNSLPDPSHLNPDRDSNVWFRPDGIGSQNHGMLHFGMSSLAWALNGNAANYDAAATKALQLLALDKLQGHQRHESLGYGPYWTGPAAAMAMAGLYAPAGSTKGPELLAAAREWWADHITVLRSIRMPDGQVGILGGRQNSPFDSGERDLWYGLYSGLIMQLVDPIPYSQLHPAISAMVTADGHAAGGRYGQSIVFWYRPLEGVNQWLVLRAVQSGALLPVPADHPMPAVDMDVYRWTANGRTYVASPSVCGYAPWRWEVSWAPGEVLRVDLAEDPGGHVGKGPTRAPNSLHIPATATHLFGPAGPATQCDWSHSGQLEPSASQL
jgi:hypothetical protein